MHTSQFPGQPNYYYPGQEYQAPTQGIKDLGLEGMQQQQQPPFMGQMPMNQAMPVDSKQQMWPNGNVPPPSFFQMFNSQLPPADASKMLMDYIQAQTGTAPNLGGPQSYGMNPGFPGQGQNNYGNNMGPYNPSGNQNDQGKRDFGGGYQNKFRNNNGGGFREREGDRGDRRDRGGRDERSDRGDRNRSERSGHGGRDDRRNDRNDRKDRNERPDRNDRGDRGERGGRDFSRNNQYDSGRGKRMDSPQRNKRSDRRSRSRSRSFERRDSNRKGGFGQQNDYNKEREGGGERFNNRGGNFNKPPFDRNQRGGDNSSQNQGNMSDWKCLGCGNVNWARRDFCNRCKVPRPENAPLVPKDESRSQSYQGKGGFEQKPNQHMNQYKRNDFKNEGYRENPSGHSNDGGI